MYIFPQKIFLQYFSKIDTIYYELNSTSLAPKKTKTSLFINNKALFVS